MNSRVVTAISLLMCLSVAPVGCRRSIPPAEEAAKAATAEGRRLVSQEEIDRAEKELNKVWDEVKAAVAKSNPSPADRQFYRDLAALTRRPHRLAGFENGSLEASRYVEKALKFMGVDELYVQEFPVVQPITTECRLFVNGKEITGKDVYQADAARPVIYQVRPNILHASVTPPEGLSGQTLYVNSGNLEDYPTLPQDKIVVMDFDCMKNWLKAFAMGARAVIFIGRADEQPAARAFHHINVPANLPRFYVPAEVAAKLKLTSTQHVIIKSACNWTELTGRNVIGVIRGADPKFGKDRAQAILLAAPLDSLSEVPYLSPGARDAANCAGLLELARYLRNHRPKRDMILCFFDGQAQNNLGASAFYGNTYRATVQIVQKVNSLEELMKIYDDELELRRHVTKIIVRLEQRFQKISEAAALAARGQSPSDSLKKQKADLNLFSAETRILPRYGDVLDVFRAETRSVSSESLDVLLPLRLHLDNLSKQLSAATKRLHDLEGSRNAMRGRKEAVPEGLSNEIDSLTKQTATLAKEADKLAGRIDRLDVEDLAWNGIERILYEKLDADDPGKVQTMHKNVTDAAKRDALAVETPVKFRELVQITRLACEQRVGELERAKARAKQSMILRDALGPGNNNILLHLSINFGDRRTRWAFIHGDDSLIAQGEDNLVNYKTIFSVLGRAGALDSLKSKVSGLYAKSIDLTYPNRLLAPAKFADSTGIARIFGLHNLSVMTVMDPMARQGQPADTFDALNKANVLAQTRQLALLLKEFADDSELTDVVSKVKLSPQYVESDWTSSGSRGAMVTRAGGASAMPDQPVRGAIVALGPTTGGPWNAGILESRPPGFQYPIIIATNTNGNMEFPVLAQGTYGNTVLFAASFDQPSKEPGAENAISRGIITAVTNAISMAGPGAKRSVVQFKTRYKTFVGHGFDRAGAPTEAMLARSTAKFQTDRHLCCELEDVVTVYAPHNAEGVKLFNRYGMVILNNDDSANGYQGIGVSLEDQFEHPITPLLTAEGLRNLNQYRLRLLHDNRIRQESLEVLNGLASDLLEDAKKIKDSLQQAYGQEAAPRPSGGSQSKPASAPAVGKGEQAGRVDKLVGEAASSSETSRCVYGPLVDVLNDLVTAVVLLLLLTIPFAYALERLLIGSPHIYRQIGWFGAFFIVTFGLLYSVNPAFRIASTPIIILLAFTIILLSTLVIFIMIRKLQTEIRRMQGLATTVHSADVSRLSTMMAAVNMGISTMRRRPLRTLLTAATVLLLTFTILTFASFGSSWGVRETYEGPMNIASPHIFIRKQLRSPIAQGTYEVLRGHYQGEAEVVPRYWVSPTAQEAMSTSVSGSENDLLIATENIALAQPIKAAVGLDARDIKCQGELAKFFTVKPTPEEAKALKDNTLTTSQIIINRLQHNGIFLTGAICNELGLTLDDAGKTILLADQELKFAGIVEEKLGGYTSLDGANLLPVDYQTSAGAGGGTFTEKTDSSLLETPDIESAQFASYSLHEVVWISAETAALISNRIRAITIYPNDPSAVRTLAQDAANNCKLPTYAGDRGGVYRNIYTSLTKASGLKGLVIPVVVGGMIIFATLLGSVSDREREIYTFSSLGLAPPHVAGLFFAEASVYAVVGGMGGYLLGQAVAQLLGWMGRKGLIDVPTINYSSTNAIVTILIVMGTVIISTIYPAIKASRSANPGVQRHWKIPSPKGNLYDLIFPFTVSSYDIMGVVSFLREHFDNFRDASLGVFATTDSAVFRQRKNDMLGFRASVALAPFDLGVNQNFALLSQPSEIEGIDEVRILIYRISGANGDWRRANRVFVNDLRKQLLIWRSLPNDTMDKYRDMTLQVWNNLPLEQVDGQSVAEHAPEGASSEAEPGEVSTESLQSQKDKESRSL